jgi:integrase
LYAVALASGLRQGEALGLRWDDVDLDDRSLTVRGALIRMPASHRGPGDARLQLAGPKTPESRRTIALPAVALSALRAHRARQFEERLAAGERWQEHGLVFASTVGTPLDGRNVTRDLQRILIAAGMPRLRYHDLRHSAASLMLAQGVDLKTIQTILGHSRIGTTADIYAHVMPQLQRAAADRMDAVLATGTASP